MDEKVSAPAPAPARRKPTARRRWLFRLILLAGLIAVAEAGSSAAYWAVEGEPFSYSRAYRHLRRAVPAEKALARTDPNQPAGTWHVEVHPYLGFSYVPDWNGKLHEENPITDWGFTDKANRPVVRKRSPNKVIVGILGASVASMFSAHGVEALARELKRSPQYSGKDIEFVSLCVGAFKQPQQLMALNYALAMGAEFDVIINIDGFNEVALYGVDNKASNIYHLYPLCWQHMVAYMPDPVQRRQVGKVAYLQDCRTQWAALFRDTPLRWSVTANLVWTVRDRRLKADIATAEMEAQGHKQEGLPFRALGPHNTFRGDDEMLEQLVTDWERCSLLIDKICKAYGIRYYHFLQPNQYVPGAKKLSAEEKKVAYWTKYPPRAHIEKGYPLLRQAGGRLRRQGVRFHDLSMIFANNGETLFFDNCCHFNHKGNELMAVPIARAILETPEPPRAADVQARK